MVAELVFDVFFYSAFILDLFQHHIYIVALAFKNPLK